MKHLSPVCCVLVLLFGVVGCGAVSSVDKQLRELDLAASSYIVRAGDTLETIAFRYKLSTEQLAALNPGHARGLVPGDHVNVRAPRQRVADSGKVDVASIRGAASSEAVPREQRFSGGLRNSNDGIITTPVYTPRKVAKNEYVPPVDTTNYTPAVNAVVTDLALLNPAPVDQSPPNMRNGVLQPDNYPYEEEVEFFGRGEPVYEFDQEPVTELAGSWIWPTKGQVARGFSPVKDGRHGVDIAGLPGQAVVAVKDGTVAYSGRDPSGTGNLIIVRHADQMLTAYSHTQDLYVAENDTVQAGDPIATLGWNARQESVLRFEVRRDGNSLNPMDFLSQR